MRKDVRTGAAIGGVLIAVIVVYAIFSSTKGHNNTKKDPIAIDPGKTTAVGDVPGGTDRAAVPDAVTGGHQDHGDAVTAGAHEPAGGNALTGPIPSHVDATPTPDSVVSSSDHARIWVAALTRGTTAAGHVPTEQIGADSPVAPISSTTPGNDIITADRVHVGGSPIPTGDMSSGPAPAASDGNDHPSAPAMKTHRIAAGETFSSIARATYGDAKFYKEIIKANPKVDPSHLHPGTLINLPDKAQASARHEAAPAAAEAPSAPAEAHHHAATAAPAIDPKTEYRVQNSDSLYRISLKLYHSANKVDAIYQLNKDQIGSDPAKLKLNMVLKLPEPPTETASR